MNIQYKHYLDTHGICTCESHCVTSIVLDDGYFEICPNCKGVIPYSFKEFDDEIPDDVY